MPTKNPAAKWYSIRKLTAMAAAVVGVVAAAEIYIYGDIGESWYDDTTTAAQFVKDLNALDAEKITVRINSLGGSVSDGLAIYNAIRRHKATITTEVDGMAFSIASLIFMAGDVRNMASNAMFMVHAPWTYAAGNSKELRDLADQLDTWASAMATSYAAGTGRTQAEMLALLTDGVDHYYTAEEAKAAGFVQAITDAMPPAATASLARDAATRYRTTPAAWLQAHGLPNAVGAPAPATTPAVAPAAAPQAAAAAPTQEPKMPDPVNNAGGNPTPDAKAILAAERARQDAIAAAYKPHLAVAGVAELLGKAQRNDTLTVEAAGLQLLAHLGATVQPVAGGGVIKGEDEADKRVAAMADAVLARANAVNARGEVMRVDASNPYRGRKLLAMAELCLQAAGVRTDGMSQMQIVGSAFTQSTSTFPLLLENTMHKTLQAGYALQADTWSLWCARGTVSDFRSHNRYRRGSIGSYDSLNELGEFVNKQIPDGEKESITATTKGNIINISRQVIINDDIGAFTGLATAFGRAGKRTIELAAYARLAENSGFGPNLRDGVSLFHADHGNVSTGAPTVTSFEAARVVMSAQKEPGGNDYLALTPDVWLGPDGIVGQAKVVNNSTYDPDAANKLQRANIANGMVRTIVGTPRLASTPWFFFADPNIAPVMEVAFLDGQDMPYLEMQPGFDQDGIRWKARLDFGVAGVDFRGAVRSTGA